MNSYTNTTEQPLGTVRVDVHADTGTVFIPDAFQTNLQVMLASLDFARVWQSKGTLEGFRMTAQELREAAKYAEALARQCQHYADRADRASAGQSIPVNADI